MERNLGTVDRMLRSLAALILVTLYLNNIIDGVLGNIFLGIAVLFLVTAVAGFCPIYRLFGVNTRFGAGEN